VDWRADDAWLDVYETARAALRLRREHPALRQRHHFKGTPTIPGGPKDLAWLHPDGREMSEPDWYDARLRTVGMFVSGDPLRSPGPEGEQQRDRSFLVWFNARDVAVEVTLMENPWVGSGEVVLSTCPENPVGTAVQAGGALTLSARSLVLLRQH
jgi:pullulanase/glycogen debranching enzyme